MNEESNGPAAPSSNPSPYGRQVEPNAGTRKLNAPAGVVGAPANLPMPTISMTVTAAPFSYSGGASQASSGTASPYGQTNSALSRPPHQPAASVEQSGSPFASAPAGYTTRPPWMTDDASLPMPAAGGGSVPPMPIFAEGTVVGQPVGRAVMGVGGTMAPMAAAAAPAAVADEDAWFAKKGSDRGSRDKGVLLRLFILVMKLVPVALMLGMAYYGYQSFFGEVSAEERANYMTSPVAGAANGGDPSKVPSSRVGLMLQQVKDSVAAHDKNVHVANAIADNPGNLTAIDDSGLASGVAAVPAKKPEPKVTVDLAGAQLAQDLRVTDDMMAGTEAESTAARAQTATLSVPDAPDAPPPSMDFRSWVSGVQIAGVRPGENARTFIDGRMARPGDIVNHKLGIVLEKVDDGDRVLVFRDRTGASVGKRY